MEDVLKSAEVASRRGVALVADMKVAGILGTVQVDAGGAREFPAPQFHVP
jgi:hypothetical protein